MCSVECVVLLPGTINCQNQWDTLLLQELDMRIDIVDSAPYSSRLSSAHMRIQGLGHEGL